MASYGKDGEIVYQLEPTPLEAAAAEARWFG